MTTEKKRKEIELETKAIRAYLNVRYPGVPYNPQQISSITKCVMDLKKILGRLNKFGGF